MTITDAICLDSPKRRQIVDGAASVFQEDGYDGASMSRIAEKAGVSKGTLYNYFTSKSDLFTAYVERETADKIAWVLEPDDSGEIGLLLGRIARRLMSILLSKSSRTLNRILISEAPKFPHLARIYYDAGQGRGLKEMSRWLQLQVEQGHLRIADPTLAAEQFVALCRTRFWIRRCLEMEEAPTDADIEVIVDANVRLFLNTYGPDTRTQPA